MHLINIFTIAMIVECFLCSFLLIRRYAREDCNARLDETATQAVQMLAGSLEENRQKLVVFADILAANSSNPDEQLLIYMENFCRTQDFVSMCIHRADGSVVNYGKPDEYHAHLDPYSQEISRLPYTSEIFSDGDSAELKFFYMAEPVVRNGKTVGILYGYMPLSILTSYVRSTSYNGLCDFYLIDTATGDFLMDTYHDGILGNIYTLGEFNPTDDYETESINNDIKAGRNGHYVFRDPFSNEKLYVSYMPAGINNWCLQVSINEATAFESYNGVLKALMVIAAIVISLMFIHVMSLMSQTAAVARRDKAQIKKSDYMYRVQRALFNAHNNPEFIQQALKYVAKELSAETTVLLTISGSTATNSYYWPETDKTTATELVGADVRAMLPILYDHIFDNTSLVYYKDKPSLELTPQEQQRLAALRIDNFILTPVVDNSGLLKAVLCAINPRELLADAELLECLSYDFFMAITNIENHSIIKQMGTMDYLTKLKNRNSYENDILTLAHESFDMLWCVFIDVNGLHDVNNTKGHKAGDIMLCTVADAIRRSYGKKYCYRVGGDEFVAFLPGGSLPELQQKESALAAELEEKGYYISIGYDCMKKASKEEFDIEKLVSSAEAKMYAEKREFYKMHRLPYERGHFPANR